ncbi:LOW QUALITY PROTEIN: cytosolic carboxypeptidase 4 [Toxotes jaculatrix]|uniref:LOW QUALITY PROTEIN: cytosolic carboxypeptidase 4 n=1 Tax=Toxotes jaculatrix TaxID=941984 RepID=UPI001B3AC39D|nr:LOW QUALITY PROTEIN: cytosolic carboxypeptidase 4 [Toxotes jaculatrix]
MFSYGRNNFTWNGTLRELEGSSPAFCTGRLRMTASPGSSSGVEVLLSALQNEGDVESTVNILNVLDELLSAGTDRRIQYMISKGGSEALLTALVKIGRSFTPNYTVLLPLLHLLAKVGHRDRRIGVKAEDAGAVLLTLNLLKQNIKHAKRAAACLWVIQVFSSSVSTANLIGENHGLDVIFHLIPQYTTKHLHTIKAAISAFAALLCTKANVCSVVSKGYVSGLLQLYEDWDSKDTQHAAIPIRHTLLRCLHKVSHSTAGRQAIMSHGGMRLLHQTTQTCLLSKGLESLVEPSVQLMRKCLPKTPLPLPSDHSAYTFPLPGRPRAVPDMDMAPDESSEESDDEEAEENQESESRDYDDDLETDLNKLRLRPDPDRPKELLTQYIRLCPELSHDFEELDLSSESEESSASESSSDEEAVLRSSFSPRSSRKDRKKSDSSTSSSGSPLETEASRKGRTPDAAQLEPHDFHSHSSILSTCLGPRTVVREAKGEVPPGLRGDEELDEEEGAEVTHHGTMTDRLLERHGACIPYHEPKLYCAAAAKTNSIPGFSILAFPDFWGHLPPPGHEPMAPRKPNVQRHKVFEDVQRFLNTDDITNQVVFDLEDSSLQCPSDSLRFFSNFECGNLRKAVQVRRYEYDLILNADANCSQHTQWFYFEVSNMVADVPYRFSVINCEKSNSQFNYGMQPVLYSVREALEGRPHWVRTGTEICYFRNHFCPARGRRRAPFYTLTFTITFKHSEDVCYLAYHYPYTYSALKAHLRVLQKSVDPSQVFFRQQILCGTLAGNSCPLVTITACPASRAWRDMHQLRNRPYIVLTGRVHPGESNASWLMKGTLEFLCSSDPVAQSLREAFVFKIIPMLNPDGVINGTSRCDLNGEDLNRQWCKPDPALSPTIYHTKGFLYYLNSIGRTPLTIPKALDRIAPAFSFNSCNYLVEKSRSATARVVVWREMGVLRSYTMESTYNGCDQGINKGLQTGTRELQEMGVKFCHSLLSVAKDLKALYSRRLISHIDPDHNIMDHKSHNCFEDDEPPCVEEIEYSADCPALKGTDLDSDVNSSMASADEDEGGSGDDEGHRGAKQQQGSISQTQQSRMKSRFFPHLIKQASVETLGEKRNPRHGAAITNGQITN